MSIDNETSSCQVVRLLLCLLDSIKTFLSTFQGPYYVKISNYSIITNDRLLKYFDASFDITNYLNGSIGVKISGNVKKNMGVVGVCTFSIEMLLFFDTRINL